MTDCVTIVDYQLGNVKSVSNAFEYLGASVVITNSPSVVKSADYLVVPGVGAFGVGIENLKEKGLDEAILSFAGSGRPLLGICLGFQMFCASSEEFGTHVGLGLFESAITRFPKTVRVPHVGWAPLESDQSKSDIFGLLPYYFIHSYCAMNALNANSLYWADYLGVNFVAACFKDNVVGVQFHPEKSGIQGLNFLQKFLKN